MFIFTSWWSDGLFDRWPSNSSRLVIATSHRWKKSIESRPENNNNNNVEISFSLKQQTALRIVWPDDNWMLWSLKFRMVTLKSRSGFTSPLMTTKSGIRTSSTFKMWFASRHCLTSLSVPLRTRVLSLMRQIYPYFKVKNSIILDFFVATKNTQKFIWIPYRITVVLPRLTSTIASDAKLSWVLHGREHCVRPMDGRMNWQTPSVCPENRKPSLRVKTRYFPLKTFVVPFQISVPFKIEYFV